jgi:hypothetical protein
MRTTGRAMLVAAAALSIALTGCTSSGNNSNGGTGGPSGATTASPDTSGSAGASSGSSTGGTGTAASCLVGNWKTTGLAGKLSGNGVDGSLTGGSGVQVGITADGKTTVNFDGMQPVQFTFKVAGSDVKGSFTYGGKVNGTVKTPTGTEGTWEPTGSVDFSALTVTADITNPATVRVADKLPLNQFVGTGQADTGNAVDAQPILRKGTFKCTGNKLELGPPAGTPGVGTWTLQKA